uniref:Uncharacterized protein n=1 Tax=Klebsiella pneumoniae TaxID=573 RepID=A0A8B0STV5_KLEPN|nr:hypothetical protein [Klebsiella pneumoniae]
MEKVPSLAELFSMYRHDIFIIAASPVYLNAVEDDLVKGVAYLPCPIKQLKNRFQRCLQWKIKRICAMRRNQNDERP